MGWGSSTRRGSDRKVRAILSSLGFEERNLGCSRNFAGMSRTPGGVRKVCAKKFMCIFRSLVTSGEVEGNSEKSVGPSGGSGETDSLPATCQNCLRFSNQGESKGTNQKGQTEPNSQILADSCGFSLFLESTAFRTRRFSQKTAGNRRFSQKTAETHTDFRNNPIPNNPLPALQLKQRMQAAEKASLRLWKPEAQIATASASYRTGKTPNLTVSEYGFVYPPLKKMTYAKKLLRNYFRGDCDTFSGVHGILWERVLDQLGPSWSKVLFKKTKHSKTTTNLAKLVQVGLLGTNLVQVGPVHHVPP